MLSAFDDLQALVMSIQHPAAVSTRSSSGPAVSSAAVISSAAFLDETDAPFVFFIDTVSGHGLVAYRRYDRDHGLIVPS